MKKQEVGRRKKAAVAPLTWPHQIIEAGSKSVLLEPLTRLEQEAVLCASFHGNCA